MTGKITRRAMLALTGSAAVAAGLPTVPHAAALTDAPPVPSVELQAPAWAVGHGGDWDWQAIAAPDADTARRIYIAEFMDHEACGSETLCEGPCEFCEALSALDVDRKPAWDGKVGKLTGADWLRADMGVNCSRCGFETDLPSGMGNIVGDEAVCDECMRLADWRIVDPMRAAEIEAEVIEDGLLPATPAEGRPRAGASDGGRDGQ